jgi:hypothetical protein
MTPMAISQPTGLRSLVDAAVSRTPVFDIHTHLYAPEFGDLNLWGVDELLTYHYLVAELFRSDSIAPADFWALGKSQQADLIWRTLFVEQTPLSEAAIGVVTTLTALGLDPSARDLREARAYFARRTPIEVLDRVLDAANVSDIVMTNDPFDPRERAVWDSAGVQDGRFHAALRIDLLLNSPSAAAERLHAEGYEVAADWTGASVGEVRRFLDHWIERMAPLYLAASLPPSFAYPEDTPRSRVLTAAVLPACRDHGLPFAMMIGVRKRVNPLLGDAGDSVGIADTGAVERLCADYPGNRFLVTMLSRENQHALCVASRKFRNLMPFGCWWFLNNPSIVLEITRERIEMLGASFIPQHSDARVLDQLLYKWPHSRRIVAEALTESYEALARAGRVASREEVERDVERLFRGNFLAFVGRS